MWWFGSLLLGYYRSHWLLHRWARQRGLRLRGFEIHHVEAGSPLGETGKACSVFLARLQSADGRVITGWVLCGGWPLKPMSELIKAEEAEQHRVERHGFQVIVMAKKNETHVDREPLAVSPATQADVPLILDLIRGLADYEKLSGQMVATEALLREHLFGPRPMAEVRIARLGDKPAGFALFFHNFSTFLGRPGIYLEDVFVYPEYRGRGIGKALLREVARVAAERNCGRLEWSVLDWNEPAIRFYESLGAKPMSQWTIYRMTDEAIKKLADP